MIGIFLVAIDLVNLVLYNDSATKFLELTGSHLAPCSISIIRMMKGSQIRPPGISQSFRSRFNLLR